MCNRAFGGLRNWLNIKNITLSECAQSSKKLGNRASLGRANLLIY
jgi:hypothetical protein